MPILKDEHYKTLYLESGWARPGAVLAHDVDYVQYGQSVEKTVLQTCVNFVRALNPDVAKQMIIWANADPNVRAYEGDMIKPEQHVIIVNTQ